MATLLWTWDTGFHVWQGAGFTWGPTLSHLTGHHGITRHLMVETQLPFSARSWISSIRAFTVTRVQTDHHPIMNRHICVRCICQPFEKRTIFATLRNKSNVEKLKYTSVSSERRTQKINALFNSPQIFCNIAWHAVLDLSRLIRLQCVAIFQFFANIFVMIKLHNA